MSNKVFKERLNKELDAIGMPAKEDERVESFSKLVKIPKFKAQAFLNGITVPDGDVLTAIAQELEVSPDWLIGKGETK